MAQLSLFSTDNSAPSVDDLSGMLAAPGQSQHVADGARISAVVAERWRAEALQAGITGAGISAEVTVSTEGSPLVRTVATPALAALHRRWSAGAVKSVPAGWQPTPWALRLWVLTAGRRDGDHYVLGLDVHAPDTHGLLADALIRAGIAPTLVGSRGATPGLRVTGKRRLSRLLETVGQPPVGGAGEWPTSGIR